MPTGQRDLVEMLQSPAVVEAMCTEGRRAKRLAFPEGHSEHNERNACGSVASGYFIELGEAKKRYLMAQDLANHLEVERSFQRGTHPRHVQPGDLIVCEDRNRNELTDHVCLVVGVMKPAGTNFDIMAADNRKPTAYKRNLGPGKYTPMWYYLRHPDSVPLPIPDTDEHRVRKAMIPLIHTLYDTMHQAKAPQDVVRMLNQLANHPWLDPVRGA